MKISRAGIVLEVDHLVDHIDSDSGSNDLTFLARMFFCLFSLSLRPTVAFFLSSPLDSSGIPASEETIGGKAEAQTPKLSLTP